MSITLKAARINVGLSQKKACELLGVSEKTLSNWEQGKTFPTPKVITKIENLYGVPYHNINFYPENAV